MKDFFVSYTKADESAAEWVASELEHAGYSIYLMKWDSNAGSNFVLKTQGEKGLLIPVRVKESYIIESKSQNSRSTGWNLYPLQQQ